MSPNTKAKLVEFLGKHRYIFDHFVWVWIGMACISALVSYFAVNTAVGRAALRPLHPYEVVWVIAFGFAGCLLIIGILGGWPEWEAFGHMLFSGVLTIYLVLIIAQSRGSVPIGLYTYPALILASVFRVLALVVLARAFGQLTREAAKNEDSECSSS